MTRQTPQVSHWVINSQLICWLTMILVVPLPVIFHNYQQGQMRKEYRAALEPVADELEGLQRDLDAAQMGSNFPLDLVINNKCVPMYQADGPAAGNDASFTTSTKVVADANGNLIPSGTAVCTRNGKSAIIDEHHKLTSIQTTPIEMMEEYQEAYDTLVKLIQGNNKDVGVNEYLIN